MREMTVKELKQVALKLMDTKPVEEMTCEELNIMRHHFLRLLEESYNRRESLSWEVDPNTGLFLSKRKSVRLSTNREETTKATRINVVKRIESLMKEKGCEIINFTDENLWTFVTRLVEEFNL